MQVKDQPGIPISVVELCDRAVEKNQADELIMVWDSDYTKSKIRNDLFACKKKVWWQQTWKDYLFCFANDGSSETKYAGILTSVIDRKAGKGSNRDNKH